MKLKLLLAELRSPLALTVLGSVVALACATSPTGRRQLTLMPDSQMDSMGVQAFQQMKTQQPSETSSTMQAYIRCVTDPLLAQAEGPGREKTWEIVVFKDDSANAFALPGKKIGVHTGLLKVAKNDSQLAAVIGHEIGHVLARHGNERVSQQVALQAGLVTAGALTDEKKRPMLLGLMGLGAQVGVLLPFSRAHETEADLMGLDLMAKAGFDPRESQQLWRNMMAAGGGGGPEFLSTHPSGNSRIEDLGAKMPQALKYYEAARAQGRVPQCKRPG